MLPCGALLSWAMAAVLATSSRANETAGTEPVHKLLVLTNGNMLSGQVTRDGNYYLVKVEHGELRVRHTDADFIADNIDEVYQRLRSSRLGSTADSHLELARWCLRFELHDYAANELTEARRIHPGHSKLRSLERQLEQAQAAIYKSTTPTTEVSFPNQQDAKVGIASIPKQSPSESRGTPKRDKQVQPAAHQQSQDLELQNRVALGEIPRAVRVGFVKQIQPMLLNSCAISGCHQPGSSQNLELDRLAIQGVGHPSVVQRNLEATIAQINRDSPLDSPLLIHASTAHGRAPHAESQPFTPRQVKLLRKWLSQMSLSAEGTAEESAPTEDATEDAAPPVSFDTDRESLFDEFDDQFGDGLLPPREVQRGVELKSFEPKDPFDPATFNRHYETLGESKSPEKRPANSNRKSRQNHEAANLLPLELDREAHPPTLPDTASE